MSHLLSLSSLPSPLLSFTPSTPFYSISSLSLALIFYFSSIFGLQHHMSTRPAISSNNPLLKWPFLVHNLVLSAGSGVLLFLMLQEVGPILWKRGAWGSVCDRASWTPTLEALYVLNYMIKFYELLDTVFLVLKKKPLAFLHVYHHSATAFLCFSQLHGRTSISWLVISLNLAVHVLMYLYYALTSLKISCPWKKWVTIAQVTQFIIDLGAVYSVTIGYYLTKWGVLKGWGCAGEEYGAWVGCGVLSSYLVLFIAFYRKTYSKSKANSKLSTSEKKPIAASTRSKTNGISNGHSNGNGKSH